MQFRSILVIGSGSGSREGQVVLRKSSCAKFFFLGRQRMDFEAVASRSL